MNRNLCVKYVSDELFDLFKAFNDLDLRVGMGIIDIASLPVGPAEDDTVLIMDWQCSSTTHLLSSLDMAKYEQFKWIFINEILEENKNLMFAINLHYIGVGSEVFLIMNKCGEGCERYTIEQGTEVSFYLSLREGYTFKTSNFLSLQNSSSCTTLT